MCCAAVKLGHVIESNFDGRDERGDYSRIPLWRILKLYNPFSLKKMCHCGRGPLMGVPLNQILS